MCRADVSVEAVKEPTKIAARRAREERLRSALRENLKRRKAQMRGRVAEPREGASSGAESPTQEGDKEGSGDT